MDPDINLREQLRLAQEILETEEGIAWRANELAELVLALDQWLTAGGCQPERWRPE